ncbi:MAG: aldose epimerase family protein [Oscillospiraceae bacterium]|jgi:aldose 1-epimerase
MTHIEKVHFGELADGTKVPLFTLTNANGSRVGICAYGAAITSIYVPDRNGVLADVVLGFDRLSDYARRDYFFGATIGRCANRIAGGCFPLGGKTYRLPCNDGRNHLHGGPRGFDTRIWDCAVVRGTTGDELVASYRSPDGEEGYPGTLDVSVTFSFDDNNALRIDYSAIPDADTLCNLTNHSYFNLAGHDSGSVLEQEVRLFASRLTESDAESISTGRLLEVAGTPMDFRDFHTLGERIGEDDTLLKYGHGYDHNYVLDKPAGVLGPCATLRDPKSGRRLDIETTLPCVQLYSGNFLCGDAPAKDGAVYPPRGGVCFETQFAPDAVHHPNFASPVLKAVRKYLQTTIYRFSAE